MLKYFLALKYLRKKKIIILSVASIALSATLLIVVGSLFSGFINALEDTAHDFVGDVVITPKGKVHDYAKFVTALNADPNISAATPVLSTQGLLHIGKGRVKAVHVWGVDLESRMKVTSIGDSLLLQSDPNSAVNFYPAGQNRGLNGFASIALLSGPDEETDKYDFDGIKSEYIGKKVVLTSGSIAGPDDDVDFSQKAMSYSDRFKVKKIPFTISDIVFTGIYQLDNRYVYMPIEGLSEKLYPERDGRKYANLFHIKLNDGANMESEIANVRRMWTDFASGSLGWSGYAISLAEIETTQQLQARHASELRKQMHLLQAIFGIVSMAAVLLIFCIFYMIVTTKLKDIAVVKSFGGSGRAIAGIFIFYGFIVGVFGAGFGWLGGWATTKNINVIEEGIRKLTGQNFWDASIYIFEKTPNQVDYQTVAWVLPAAVLAAMIGAIIPAISAAKVEPVKLLQYE